MKNHLFSFVALCLVVFVSILSCDKGKLLTKDVSQSQSSLLSQLKDVNANFCYAHPCTKGPSRRSAIIWADAAGAYEGGKWGAEHGGIVGAACGSPIAGAVITGMICGLVVGGISSYMASADFVRDPSLIYDNMINVYHDYISSNTSAVGEFGILQEVDYTEMRLDNNVEMRS